MAAAHEPPVRFRSKRPQSSLLARTWWIGILILVAVAGAVFMRFRPEGTKVLGGYITDRGILEAEYLHYYRKPLGDPELERKFRRAETLTIQHDYSGAAAVLEMVLADAAVPSVYNNLGVLYAEMNDRGHSLNAFRNGFALDGSYAAIRRNMDRLKQLTMDSGDPVNEEIEPNGTLAHANPIAVNTPVEAAIAGKSADEDTFKFAAPPPPRDVLAIRVSTAAPNFIPGLRVYDVNHQMIERSNAERAPGAPLTQFLSPQPNSLFYLQVFGVKRTDGAYVLKVEALKAFDRFEPNDGIFSARKIDPGTPVEANIMDAEDTDYYQFIAPRPGLLSIEIDNQSTTLIPALTTFHPDRRNSGFGPDVRTPGGSLRHGMEVEQNQTYFIQVWSQGNSSGAYRLTVGN